MKIEHKPSAWCCGHKSQNGHVDSLWRAAHKKARGAWKAAVFMRKYDELIKRV